MNDEKCIHVLVVDDSRFARKATAACLAAAGLGTAEVSEAENGKVALELLRTRGADLVVTDLNMPEMDGAALLRRIRIDPRLNHVPVVLVSSVVGPAVEKHLMRLGANAVVQKPFTGPVASAVLPPLLAKLNVTGS